METSEQMWCQLDKMGWFIYPLVIKRGNWKSTRNGGGVNRKITEPNSVSSIAMFDYQRVTGKKKMGEFNTGEKYTHAPKCSRQNIQNWLGQNGYYHGDGKVKSHNFSRKTFIAKGTIPNCKLGWLVRPTQHDSLTKTLQQCQIAKEKMAWWVFPLIAWCCYIPM